MDYIMYGKFCGIMYSIVDIDKGSILVWVVLY